MSSSLTPVFSRNDLDLLRLFLFEFKLLEFDGDLLNDRDLNRFKDLDLLFLLDLLLVLDLLRELDLLLNLCSLVEEFDLDLCGEGDFDFLSIRVFPHF